jgi:ADP-heptose:LPS heptosyltransferase
MTLDDLSPLLDRSDCNFVSLQYGEVASEIDHFNAGRERKIKFFYKREIDDFEDFAALIDALDCVVSVQNTTVHTCGALGKKCLTILPKRPEWRYGTSGPRMPWYSSVELYRQSPAGPLTDMLNAINDQITNLIEGVIQ